MISANVPNHLVVNARTGFLNSMMEADFAYKRFTTTFDMNAKEVVAVDLGAAPMPKNSPSGLTIQEMIERSKTLTVVEWDITVHISHNAVKDDQTSSLESKTRGAGRNFEKHKNKLAFQALNGGDGTDYGLCYDGSDFFDNDHVDSGAAYQTSQDNEGSSALSLDNFETAWAATQSFRDDQGEFVEPEMNLLVVHPTNRQMAAQIADNPNAEGTGNRDINPNMGAVTYVTSPYLDSTAWFILAESEGHKPLIVAERETPHLQHAWFDPAQPDGGWYLFKFYARYDIHYGDWRLAYMGNT